MKFTQTHTIRALVVQEMTEINNRNIDTDFFTFLRNKKILSRVDSRVDLYVSFELPAALSADKIERTSF